MNEIVEKIKNCKSAKQLAEIYKAHQGQGYDQIVASHPEADDMLLKLLAHHGNKMVRLSVAKNKATGLEVLKKLASDKDVTIREAARYQILLKR